VGRFQFGDIIVAYMSDGHGRTKDRPSLIISSDEENDRGEDLQVIAITTKIECPCPPYHFVISPDAANGLSAPSVAKCNWVRDVPQNKVIKSVGYLDEGILTAIVDAFDKLYEEATLNNNWDLFT
jgi:mRNA-degrading endonuclease toxin of MazEF toxin-antitoxin module